MTPQNSKSLFHFLCDQMEKLDKSEITVEQAKAQANIAKQVNNVLKYELDRAKVLMDINTYNKENTTNIELREVESKKFENISE